MAKTKALISFAVTAKLICVFVFAYSKSRFLTTRLKFEHIGRTTRQMSLKDVDSFANSEDPDQAAPQHRPGFFHQTAHSRGELF